jgi:hypothetical protein
VRGTFFRIGPGRNQLGGEKFPCRAGIRRGSSPPGRPRG